MSHEGTTGVLTEAVGTNVQAMVQALVSEPITTAGGAAVGAAVIEEGEGAVVRAIETGLAEVEQGAPEPKLAPKEPRAEAQTGAGVAGKAATKVRTARVKKVVTKARAKVAPKREPAARKRAESEPRSRAGKGTAIDHADADKMIAKSVKTARANQALSAGKASKPKPRQEPVKFTVPEVWRSIVKKNERQGAGRFDVLVCQHAVPANDNTYRTARSCPECRVSVQRYADQVTAARARKGPRRLVRKSKRG